MVNSVTITANGIEAVVETINEATNVTTNKVKSGYSSATKAVHKVITAPKTTQQFIAKLIRQTLDRIRTTVDYIIRSLFRFLRIFFTQLIALTVFMIQTSVKILMHFIGKYLPDFRAYHAVRVIENLFYAVVFRVQNIFNKFNLKIKIL